MTHKENCGFAMYGPPAACTCVASDSIARQLRDKALFYSKRDSINEQRYTPNACEISRLECLELADLLRSAADALERAEENLDEMLRAYRDFVVNANAEMSAGTWTEASLMPYRTILGKFMHQDRERHAGGAWAGKYGELIDKYMLTTASLSLGEMVRRLKERIEKINEKSVLGPAIEAANAPGLAGFQNDHKQFSKGWDGCARRVTPILAEAADLLSRLSAAREAVLEEAAKCVEDILPTRVAGHDIDGEAANAVRRAYAKRIRALKSAAGSGDAG